MSANTNKSKQSQFQSQSQQIIDIDPDASTTSSNTDLPISHLVSSTVSTVNTNSNRFIQSYNNKVIKFNGALNCTKRQLSTIRQKHPVKIVAASTIVAGLLSAPYGRFPAIRNAILVGLFSSWLVWPQSITTAAVIVTEDLKGNQQ